MITINSMTPETASTRMRALSDTVTGGLAHVDTQLFWSLLPVNCGLATTTRENSGVNAVPTARPNAAAALGAASAPAGIDNSIGRKQGRPPRGEPR